MRADSLEFSGSIYGAIRVGNGSFNFDSKPEISSASADVRNSKSAKSQMA